MIVKVDLRNCDRCGAPFVKCPKTIYLIHSETRSAPSFTNDLDYTIEKEIDLCIPCSAAFLGFMDEMKPDPAAGLPDDLENYIPDSYEMMRGGVNPLALPDDERC